jgi:hypothetical protein
VTVVDWDRYQKCPVCAATQPHTGRKLRAEAARAGGGR